MLELPPLDCYHSPFYLPLLGGSQHFPAGDGMDAKLVALALGFEPSKHRLRAICISSQLIPFPYVYSKLMVALSKRVICLILKCSGARLFAAGAARPEILEIAAHPFSEGRSAARADRSASRSAVPARQPRSFLQGFRRVRAARRQARRYPARSWPHPRSLPWSSRLPGPG